MSDISYITRIINSALRLCGLEPISSVFLSYNQDSSQYIDLFKECSKLALSAANFEFVKETFPLQKSSLNQNSYIMPNDFINIASIIVRDIATQVIIYENTNVNWHLLSGELYINNSDLCNITKYGVGLKTVDDTKYSYEMVYVSSNIKRPGLTVAHFDEALICLICSKLQFRNGNLPASQYMDIKFKENIEKCMADQRSKAPEDKLRNNRYDAIYEFKW